MILFDMSTEELKQDRREAIEDKRLCEAALSQGLVSYKIGGKEESIAERIEADNKIIASIEKELASRGEQ